MKDIRWTQPNTSLSFLRPGWTLNVKQGSATTGTAAEQQRDPSSFDARKSLDVDWYMGFAMPLANLASSIDGCCRSLHHCLITGLSVTVPSARKVLLS